MLVALRAVCDTTAGQVSHPADAPDEMRERSLLLGVRAPFGWNTRLCTYGKKIQNSTTSMGYIYWSDDEQTPSVKDLRLSMRGLRKLIVRQVSRAQAELDGGHRVRAGAAGGARLRGDVAAAVPGNQHSSQPGIHPMAIPDS
jgi:hypothetical protein